MVLVARECELYYWMRRADALDREIDALTEEYRASRLYTIESLNADERELFLGYLSYLMLCNRGLEWLVEMVKESKGAVGDVSE